MVYNTLQITHAHNSILARQCALLQEVVRVTETITSIWIPIACGTRLNACVRVCIYLLCAVFMPFEKEQL